MELTEHLLLALVGLDDFQRRHRFLHARREVAVGDAVGERSHPEPRRHPSRRDDDRDTGCQTDERNPRVKKRNENKAHRDAIETHDGAHDRFSNHTVDHGAVLVHAKDRVANPGLVVIFQGQVLCAFDHGNPQILVNHLPDPQIVVDEGSGNGYQGERQTDKPDDAAIPHHHPLRICKRLFEIDVVRDVARDIGLIDEHQARLHKL